MHISTRGIVLHKTKYSETSIIANVFTRSSGMQSFIVKGAYAKSKRSTLALLENLSIVDLTFDDNGRDVKYLHDISLHYSYQLLPFDMVRRALSIFYNEMIYKILREYQADAQLYDFVESSLLQLDAPDTVLTDVHLHFLVDLSKIMGFAPVDNYSETRRFFSVDESCFVHEYFDYPTFLAEEASQYLCQLMRGEQVSPLPVKQVRSELLEGLIRYFEAHNEQIHRIESVEILSRILS